MHWRLLTLIACIGGLSISASSALILKASVEPTSSQLSPKQLQYLAESITVKVLSEGFLGSGILLQRQGSVYTVLTNAHVLRSGKPPYQIQTADGHFHQASFFAKSHRLPHPSDARGSDLALLQFRSSHTTYAVAALGSTSTLGVGNQVYAAGFPFDTEGFKDIGFTVRTGRISLVLNKALEGGYQIGYTNEVQKGMSGGPLLNRDGQVVAINGMQAEPLWGNPYVYQDGTEPEIHLRNQMSKYSWGIPIEIGVKLVSPLLPATDPRRNIWPEGKK